MIDVGIYTREEFANKAMMPDIELHKMVQPDYHYICSRKEKRRGKIFWHVYLLNVEEYGNCKWA